MKRFTSHNEKIGFDFNNLTRTYVAGYGGGLFQSSAYVDFLSTAKIFYTGNAEVLAHIGKTLDRFTINDEDRDRKLADRG